VELAWYPSGARVALPFTHFLSRNGRTRNVSVINCDSGETDFVIKRGVADAILIDWSDVDLLVPFDFVVHVLRPLAMTIRSTLPTTSPL